MVRKSHKDDGNKSPKRKEPSEVIQLISLFTKLATLFIEIINCSTKNGSVISISRDRPPLICLYSTMKNALCQSRRK